MVNAMKYEALQPFRARLAEKLADSLVAPFPAVTTRRVHGAVTLPGKATAVVGMRPGRQDDIPAPAEAGAARARRPRRRAGSRPGSAVRSRPAR